MIALAGVSHQLRGAQATGLFRPATGRTERWDGRSGIGCPRKSVALSPFRAAQAGRLCYRGRRA